MRIYIDEETWQITASPGVRQQLETIAFRRGNSAAVEVQFFRGGDIVERPAASVGSFSLKTVGDYDGDAIVEALSWVKTGTGLSTVYTFYPNFNTTELNDLLGHDSVATDVKYVDLMMGIRWNDGGGAVGSSIPPGDAEITARVWNDINKGTTSAPSPGGSPYPEADYLIRHLDGITGWDDGGSPLETVGTTGFETGQAIVFLVDGQPYHAKLVSGANETSTTSNPVYVKPDDHDAATNNRVWISYAPPLPSDDVVVSETTVQDAATLAAVDTTGLTTGAVRQVGSKGLFMLLAGDADTVGYWIIKPDDHDGATNNRVWVRVLPESVHLASTTGLMGFTSSDLDYVPTEFMTEGQVVALATEAGQGIYALTTKSFTEVNITSTSGEKLYTGGVLPALHDVVEFFTTDTLFSGFSLLTHYYVVEVDEGENWFKVSTEHSGTAQTVTGSGAGTQSFCIHEDPFWVRPKDHADSGMAWQLVGPTVTRSLLAEQRGTILQNTRYSLGFAPEHLKPSRIQFDLGSAGGDDSIIGLEAAGADLIAAGSITLSNRTNDTSKASATVQNIIYRGDEIVADVSQAGGAKGLLVHVTGVEAKIQGKTVGAQAATSETGIIAVAGSDQSVSEGATVTLDSSGSTANVAPVTYTWEQLTGTSVTISDTAAATPTFTAPQVEVETELTFRLTVQNTETLEQDTDEVAVTVQDIDLTAEAGPNQTVDAGATVTLDSTGSTERDPGVIEYEWEQIWGPKVEISDATAASPTFLAPSESRVCTFRLHVRNVSVDAEETDEVTIDVIDSTAYTYIPVPEAPHCACNNDARVLIGCENGKLVTSDDMAEWFVIDTGISDTIDAVASRDDGRAVIAAGDKLYYSRDGISWVEEYDPYSSYSVNAIDAEAGYFIAVGDNGKIYRSTNGIDWSQVDAAAAADNFLCVKGNGANWLAGAQNGVVSYSTDYGETWTEYDTGSDEVRGITYSPSLDLWLLVGTGGFCRTLADADIASISTELVNDDFPTGIFNAADWDPTNSVFLIVGNHVAYTSHNGEDWTLVSSDMDTPGIMEGVANHLGRFAIASRTQDAIIMTPEYPAS